MSIKSIKEKLIKNSVVDDQWKKEAEYRIENEEWLDISFSIAVKTISAMKQKGISQKQLAKELDCTPQYVSKLLKGKEKLNIESIVKIGKILDIKLIEVPRDYVQYKEPERTVVFRHVERRLEEANSIRNRKFNYNQEREHTFNFNSQQWQKKTQRTSCSALLN